MADNDNSAARGQSAVKPRSFKDKATGLFKKIKKGADNIRLEMKRVTWPTWRELINYTVTVLAVCAVMGALIYALDMGLQQLLLVTLQIGA